VIEWRDGNDSKHGVGRRTGETRPRWAAFRASGLTRRAFARQEGIRYTTFCAWVRWAEPADRRPALAAKAAVRFAEVAQPAGVAQVLEVRLPDGTTLRGARVGELAALVRALRG
jgi:hypothetical protein